MLLALDVGNTNVTVGVFDGDTICLRSRMATDTTKTADQHAIELMNLFSLYKLDIGAFEGAIISSVVPQIEPPIRRAVETVLGVSPIMVGPGVKTGLNIAIDNPAQLGADLLVGAVAAVHEVGAPCVVWDLGTATTVFAVDKSGNFVGGAIMAGVRTAVDSLIARTALLPRFRLEPPAHVIGRNSNESMQSGAVFGTAAMMDGMTERLFAEWGYNAPVVVTGGIGRDIVPYCRTKAVFDDDLLLKGLNLIYKKNR